MYNICNLNLSLSSLAFLNIDQDNYYIDGEEISDYLRLEPHLQIEAYYNNVPKESVVSYSIKINNQQVTLSEMIHQCHIELFPKVNNYQCLLLSNSFSDRQPEIQALPRILEWSDIKPKNYFGISHLSSIASIESLEILELSFNEEEDGILLLGEQLIIEKNRYCEGYSPFADFAMGMHFSKGYGPIQVLQIGSYFTSDNELNSNNSEIIFSEIINQIIELVSQQHQLKRVIVQNLFSHMVYEEYDALYIRQINSTKDYQSGDVWYTFLELLSTEKLNKEEKILIISANRDLSTSFAILQFNELPIITSIKW